MTGLVQAATVWYEAGCSVIPIKPDGTKKPLFEWKRFMTERANPTMIQFWLDRNPGAGIGVVCGQVSGNLELLEIEGRATDGDSLARIQVECAARDVDSTWDYLSQGLCVMSPSGGMHLIYRVEDHEVPGNTKVASRPATDEEFADNPKAKVKVLAETRGEGGYFVAAPTGGSVHPTGLDWRVVAGEVGDIPTINWAERNALHEAVHAALDQMPTASEPVYSAPIAQPYTGDVQRPGDDFNYRAQWSDSNLLGGAGWTVSHTQGHTTYWIKPGSNVRDGHHATTGRDGVGASDRLYVFSTSTEFDTETPLSKFAVYTILNHGGDYKAATRALADMGYGEPLVLKPKVMPMAEFLYEPAEPVRRPLLPTPRGVEDYSNSGAVARLVQAHGNFIRYVAEEKIWRIWDGVAWRRDEAGTAVTRAFEAMTEDMREECERMRADPDQADIAKAYKKHIQKLRDSSRVTILSLVASWVTVSAEAFDADPRYLNLRNGVYDMVADAFLPHDPKYLLTKVAGISYDPAATAVDAEAFLESVLPVGPMREFTLQALGDALTGEADRKAFFVLQGLSNSGKTQILEMAQTIFGEYAVPVSPGAFAQRHSPGAPTPELHEMRGARFIFTSETSHELQLDEEMVKRFTGKDTMTTRTLYQKPQRWVPQGTVWVATNNLPRFSADEEAMWRRVKTIRFTNVFTDDGSSGHLAIANIGRMLAAKEGSGIFNLLLAALRRLRSAGRLVEPQELLTSVSDHRKETDTLARHLGDLQDNGELVADPDYDTNLAQVYQGYRKVCEADGVPPLGPQRFGMALRQHLKYETKRANSITWMIGWRFTGTAWLSHGPTTRQRQ